MSAHDHEEDEQEETRGHEPPSHEEMTREGYAACIAAALGRAGYAFNIEADAYAYNGGLWDREHVAKALFVYKAKDFAVSRLGLEVALAEYEQSTRVKELRALRVVLGYYDPNHADAPARAVLAFMQRCAPTDVSHLDVAALQSMLWQIKRKVAGHYGLQNPLMLFFTGGQGSGKTAILRRVLAPIQQWVGGNTSFKVFRDRGSKGSFGNYYVLPFNDAGENDLRKSDMDELKSLITETDFAFRAPYGRKEIKYPNIATCYSTSNWNVSSLIADDSGARRWWEIKVPSVDWDEKVDDARLAGLPIDALWRSVNGLSATNPRTVYIDEYRVVQNATLRPESRLEECLGASFTRTGKESDTMTQDEVFVHFVKTWAKLYTAKGRAAKGDLWRAMLYVAPLRKDGGLSTRTDNVYIFRGVVANTSLLEA